MSSIDTENVLRNFGGASRNDLNKVINAESNTENEPSLESFSPYKTIDLMPEYMVSHKNGFTVLTLNCQSLNAKFDQLKVMLASFSENNFNVHIICLQETWVRGDPPDLSFFTYQGIKIQ